MDPGRANALMRTLGSDREIPTSAPLPPFFHQLYFWDAQPPEQLGRDGHPKTGGLIPDMGDRRRMWAGGRLRFHHPLRAGIPAEKTTRLIAREEKTGRSGSLSFVTLEHRITQQAALCVTEEQDLVYRAASDPKIDQKSPPVETRHADITRTHRFDTTQLFRYSALTFNGHRIHYDIDYARDIEGYAGLVVHGPLIAQLMMLMAEEHLGPLADFTFRGTAPLMHFEPLTLHLAGQELWATGPGNRLCMTGRATPAA